jgi:SAM-dependent methyltransferase
MALNGTIPGMLTQMPIGTGVRAHGTSGYIWHDFIQWLQSTNSAASPEGLLDEYRVNLRATNTDLLEIERQLSIVTDRMNEDVEGWRWIFNRVYANIDRFTMAPNAFMARVTQNLKPGRALDICMGQGRNALHLVSRGWQVTGFDVAEQGLIRASRNFRRLGLKLRAIQMEEHAFAYGLGAWDLILIVYAPVQITSAPFVTKIRRALRPGGAVVIETFAYDSRVGRTRMGSLEIDSSELLKAFEGFSILEFEDITALPDWSASRSRIVRLLARND